MTYSQRIFVMVALQRANWPEQSVFRGPSGSEHALKGPFLQSIRGSRKEIAQLQQSFALLAVRRKFLEFYCDLFFLCPPAVRARRRSNVSSEAVGVTGHGTWENLAVTRHAPTLPLQRSENRAPRQAQPAPLCWPGQTAYPKRPLTIPTGHPKACHLFVRSEPAAAPGIRSGAPQSPPRRGGQMAAARKIS